MARDASPLPQPPAEPPVRLPALVEQPLLSWRIHQEPRPLELRRYTTGKFRFDAPAGEFPVTYANLDRHACYAEAFGDAREIPPAAGDRRLSRIQSYRPLRLIALDLATVQKAFGLDLAVCSSRDYSSTQSWSRAWHGWYPEADGIRYLGRHAVEKRNLCLYLDRCGSDLEAVFEGELRDLRRDGLIAAHRYHLVPRLYLG